MPSQGAGEKQLNKDGVNQPRRELPEKVFVPQNSIITELRKSKHFRAVEHVLMLALLFWALSNLVPEYRKKRSISALWPSFDLLTIAFANYQVALIAWSKSFCLTLAFYLLVRLWVRFRPTVAAITNFDRLFTVAYMAYQVFFVWLTWNLLFRNRILGPATAAALSLEQCRLVAKMHSFAREISKKIWGTSISHPKNDETDDFSQKNWKFPTFSHYLYFLFAPTLVYRDVYPRTVRIKWRWFFLHVIDFAGCFIIYCYVVGRYVFQEMVIYLTQPVTSDTIINTIFCSFIPGTVMFLIFFYSFFHTYLNAWAEVLRFGDRLFYRDWWNLTDPGSFFHKWNTVVHDWLYTYVYKESYDLLKLRKSKVVPTFLAFVVSCSFHEYVIVAMFGFFFPLMSLTLVGFGFAGSTLLKWTDQSRVTNFICWIFLFLTWGTWLHLYFFEAAAHQLCPTTDSNNSLLVPRFLSCLPNSD